MDSFYVKVDDRFYAEHADGSAFLTKEKALAVRFPERKTAKLIASSLAGARVHIETFAAGIVDRS